MNKIIAIWCLFSIANCIILYGKQNTEEIKNALNNSPFTPEFVRPTLYIIVIALGPVLFINKLIKDLSSKK